MPDFLAHPPPLVVRELPPNPELLSALGRLVRGLSVLFWGLPIALVVCTMTATGEWFRQLGGVAGVVPPLVATGSLLYGLTLLGHFQKQEHPWVAALDRARLLALVNFGLSPFLYWWSRVPSHPFLLGAVQAIVFTGLLFLIFLNPVLMRLTSMLPDETLRLETKLFTSLNRAVLLVILVLVTIYGLAIRLDPGLPSRFLGWLLKVAPFSGQTTPLIHFIDFGRQWIVLFFVLLPLAMTMALIWKIKEVILASVFGPEH